MFKFSKKELNKVSLDDIPEFTKELSEELKALKLDKEADVKWAKNDRLMALSHLRASNLFKKLATDKWINWYEKSQVNRAKRSYLRYLKKA